MNLGRIYFCYWASPNNFLHCDKLTPCSSIRDGRIEQFVEPWRTGCLVFKEIALTFFYCTWRIHHHPMLHPHPQPTDTRVLDFRWRCRRIIRIRGLDPTGRLASSSSLIFVILNNVIIRARSPWSLRTRTESPLIPITTSQHICNSVNNQFLTKVFFNIHSGLAILLNLHRGFHSWSGLDNWVWAAFDVGMACG